MDDHCAHCGRTEDEVDLTALDCCDLTVCLDCLRGGEHEDSHNEFGYSVRGAWVLRAGID